MPTELDRVAEQLLAMEAGAYQPERPQAPHPERIPLYGGISGLSLATPEFRFCDGLMIRETYAHIFAPYMMAFARPKITGAPHPAPWKAAKGGLAFDITAEVSLALECQPTGLDRLNTVWWVLALLRLATGAPLRMPVISDLPFAAVPGSPNEPNLWTVEMPPTQFRVTRHLPAAITVDHLEWVRKALIDGARLLDKPDFNRAFQTFDSAIWAHNPGSAIIMAWASLETLFRPGRRQITKTLATCVATFLHPPGPARDRTFQRVEQLYEARGNVAHDAQVPEADQLLGSFELVRSALMRAIEIREAPRADQLIERWRSRI